MDMGLIMTKKVWALLGLLGAVSLAGMGADPARAEEGVAMKNLLGSIGIIPAERDPIRYRERAPLVLPPKMELRAPAGPESFAASNPQWPNDPDVVARKRRRDEEAVPVTESEIRRMSENNPRLSIDEMRAGRSTRNAGPGRHVSDKEGVWVNPTELASTRKDDTQTADAGPAQRRTLADPPTTYRQAARGGVVNRSFEPRIDQQQQDANPINWLTSKFRGGEDDE